MRAISRRSHPNSRLPVGSGSPIPFPAAEHLAPSTQHRRRLFTLGLALLLVPLARNAAAQAPGVITTVAGTGQTRTTQFGAVFGTFGGDGGPATSAGLNFPSGVAVDAGGNLFVADTYNNRIRKVAAETGIITTVAGGRGFGGDGDPATSAGRMGDYVAAFMALCRACPCRAARIRPASCTSSGGPGRFLGVKAESSSSGPRVTSGL